MKSLVKKAIAALGYTITSRKAIPVTTRQIEGVVRLHRLYERIKGLPGDVVECGVGRGRTFLYLVFFAQKEGRGRGIFGFDSFAGFPEPSASDESMRMPKKGEWKGETPDSIREILETAGIPRQWIKSNVRLERGFFRDSLSRFPGTPIAFLHLDADLYESHVEVLEALYPKLVQGGVLLFDDYGDAKWPGATKAVDEFLKKTGEKIESDEWGKHYIIKKHVR